MTLQLDNEVLQYVCTEHVVTFEQSSFQKKIFCHPYNIFEVLNLLLGSTSDLLLVSLEFEPHQRLLLFS